MNLIVTAATHGFPWIVHSEKFMRQYARKVGAAFLVIRESRFQDGHYDLVQALEKTAEYDRVLFLDADVMVHPDAPDIFQIVPDGKIGIYEETHLHGEEELTLRKSAIARWANRCGAGQMDCRRHFNSGVVLLERQHFDKLRFPPAFVVDHLWDQMWLDMNLALLQDSVFSLPQQFNDVLFGHRWDQPHFYHFTVRKPLMATVSQSWDQDHFCG